MRFIIVMMVLLLTPAPPASAEEMAAAPAGGFSFRPPAAGQRDWFPIMEFGVALRPSFERVWNVGLARPVSNRLALGGVVTITDDSGTTIAAGPMGRINLGRTVTLDIAPELLVQGRRTRFLETENPSPDVQVQSIAVGKAPGFALDAALMLGDWGGLFARTTLFPYGHVTQTTYTRVEPPGGGTTWQAQGEERVDRHGLATAHRFGVRAGSYPGLGLGLLAVVVSAVVYETIEN